MKHTFSSYKLSSIILLFALLLVVTSVLFTNNLARQLALAEESKMKIWAAAEEQLNLASEEDDISFVNEIIESNTTIPAYLLDSDNQVLAMRNVNRACKNPTSLHGPITIDLGQWGKQYIYYDDSTLLRQLKWFPYIEFGLIFLFFLIAIVTLSVAQRSEQNRVWAGLSKETAHQLGTPISSLNAWQELLESTYPDDTNIPLMRQDITRLQTITERFSKIGSMPDLENQDLKLQISYIVNYMRTRLSDKVQIVWEVDSQTPAQVPLNAPLFGWVLENLIRNAVDAMSGVGKIHITLLENEDKYCVEVSDNGRGMDRKTQRKIFLPGFTSKQRGWGLGLSLSKRIIEDYHGGHLLLKSSQLGVGTTFRIVLEKAKNS